ncbi:hypothetical protein LJQ72_10590 [Pectobacterium brasiliense]|uniref:hypothetical protein n=1 Tax=Pectobacterium brasiliense TaxID=180957 RepID=UPI001D0D31CC|nr:hypothetical protein [Pectobacterium brasiliense]UDQ77959.1 hypothetical protein LJQ72_10590 [Pectobacterium brasiliense]
MSCKMFIIPIALLTLSACSESVKPTSNVTVTDPRLALIAKSADECSAMLQSAAKGKIGTVSVETKFYDNIKTSPLGNGIYSAGTIVGVPYVTATVLDNGTEGSAWRSCMQQKNAL